MDSGESTDEGKRKREEEKHEVFRRSVRVKRSPEEKSRKIAKDKKEMEEIMGSLREIKAELREIKEQNKMYSEEISELRKENSKQKNELEILKTEKQEIEKKIKRIEERMERTERRERKNNIIIKGTGIKGEVDIKERVEVIIKEKLGVEAKIKKAHQLAKEKDIGILVQMEEWEGKREVMKNKIKLRGGQIYIDDDLTRNERNMQKRIREIEGEERKKGKRTKIGYRKLMVDGNWYRWDEVENRLENFQ